MSIFAIVLLAATAVLVVYASMTYNSLVSVKHNVSKAWANIEVLLKQRHDEIPKLVEVCKQYRQFEQDTLQRVIEARSKVFNATQSQNMGELGKAEVQLRGSLGNLFAVAESYPELKTNEQFYHAYYAPTWPPQWSNYLEAWNQIRGYFLNSISVTAVSVLVSVLLAALAAYAFARYRFPGSSALYLLILLVLLIPATLTLIPAALRKRNSH